MKRLVGMLFLCATLRGAGPAVFFTDVDSGPTSGGEGNNGIYMTIGGNNFGLSQGNSTVRINGVEVAQYLTWNNTRIGVQVGPVSTGAVTVTVGGVTATGPTFTVRAGNIYYIGPNTDNSTMPSCSTALTANSYTRPWGLTNYASLTETNYTSALRTPTWYVNCVSPGDVVVFLDGANYPYFDGRQWHASLSLIDLAGTSTSPITIMARPGGSVTLGGYASSDGSEGVQYGIRKGVDYITVSGLSTISKHSAGIGIAAEGAGRIINNEVQCPPCNTPAGALDHPGPNEVVLGNYIHNVSTALPLGSSKLYHAIYIDANNVEVAWNTISNTKAYNGIQVNNNSGAGVSNQSYHDNYISDLNGSGINFSTVGFSSGTYVVAYNNVIHHTGVTISADGSADDPHSCFAFKGYSTDTAAGTVQVYNNTMYDCSSRLNEGNESASCAIVDLGKQMNIKRKYVNNIIYQPAYTYTSSQNVFLCGGITNSQQLTQMAGSSHNLWYSASTPGSTLQAAAFGTITDPMMNNPGGGDFTLAAGSPAINGGIATGALTDIDGVPRLNGSYVDIGAFEFQGSALPTGPIAPLGISLIVH